MKKNSYSLAFTTMATQIPEKITVVDLYNSINNWDMVRKDINKFF